MCEIIEGYDLICDAPGGIDTLYMFSTKTSAGVSNVATYTTSAGEVTALTLETGKYAYPFNIEIGTASFNDKSVGERGTNGYGRDQTGTAVLHGNTASMIVNIEAMVKGRVAVIVKLADGTYELFGAVNGMKVLDDRATGTAYEDMNGTTLTFAGKEKTKACKISSAIVAALLEPAS